MKNLINSNWTHDYTLGGNVGFSFNNRFSLIPLYFHTNYGVEVGGIEENWWDQFEHFNHSKKHGQEKTIEKIGTNRVLSQEMVNIRNKKEPRATDRILSCHAATGSFEWKTSIRFPLISNWIRHQRKYLQSGRTRSYERLWWRVYVSIGLGTLGNSQAL